MFTIISETLLYPIQIEGNNEAPFQHMQYSIPCIGERRGIVNFLLTNSCIGRIGILLSQWLNYEIDDRFSSGVNGIKWLSGKERGKPLQSPTSQNRQTAWNTIFV